MMLKKRGFLVVLLLVILLSFSGLAGWNGHCADPLRCVSIVMGVTSCEFCEGGASGKIPVDCNNPEEGEQGQCQSLDEGHSDMFIPLMTSDDICEIGPSFPPQIQAHQPSGCWFAVGDYDSGSDDECGVGRAAPGENWGNGDGPSNYISKQGINEDLDIVADWLLDTTYIDNKWEYICSDNGYWEKCLDDSHLGNKIVGDGAAYECAYDVKNGAYEWVTDRDGDGYTTSDDCNDDTTNDLEIGLGIVCPELTSEENVGKTVNEIRETARGYCEANPGLYSQCAICINAGAAEVCGDNINNDCGGPGAGEDITELSGATSDNCHENQASCEQGFVGHCTESNAVCGTDDECNTEEGEQCNLPESSEEPTGVCVLREDPAEDEPMPEKVGDSCTQDSSCGDTSVWFCDKASVHAQNIYGEDFDWIETDTGAGYCCGYNGASDVGGIVDELDSQQSHVCLTDNDDFVSTEKDFDGNGIDEIFDNAGCGAKNWCWVDAAAANNMFKIFTIKRPGETVFDVVSNADDWLTCGPQEEKTFEPPALAEGQEEEVSNRFYCYQEGNRWAWAECTLDWNKRENPSVKGRYTGEGLYTLPLPLPAEDLPEDPTLDLPSLRESKIDKSVVIDYKELYNKYYGKGFLDFSGYGYLNFMVRFVQDPADCPEGCPAELDELKLPLRLTLRLVGPDVDSDPLIYFEQDVLGYVINTPLSDLETYMHVQVPLEKDYKAVEGFRISSESDNFIQVRNIYLTSDDTNLPNQLCSGQDSAAATSWIPDADAGDPDVGITGKNLCEALYGEEAWLGEDQEVSELEPAANCCGNAKNEYYSGISKGYVDPELGSEATYFGCWNSEPIASGDTVMDVEFEVESQETQLNVDYSDIPLPTITLNYRVFTEGSPTTTEDDIFGEGTFNCNQDDLSNILEVGDTSTILCSFNLARDNIFSQIFYDGVNQEYFDQAKYQQKGRGITKIWFEDPVSDNIGSAIELAFYDRATNTEIGDFVSSTRIDQDDEDFELVGPAQYLTKEEAMDVWYHPISVIARLRPGYFFPISNPTPTTNPVTKTVTYACSETECLFPLPGNPPYKVTNLHPELYELYYVTGTLAAAETPVTDQPFPEYANLRVKRIAQQVLFYNEGEESTRNVGFYGCRAADFIQHLEENMQYCAVVDEKFCSYSEVFKEDSNKDEFTVVNTWSDEDLTKVGYDTSSLPDPEDQNISTYYEQVELTLKDQLKLASSRNQSTAVLPARNFISNAEFATSATKLPYWEVLVNNQVRADEKSDFVHDHKVTLSDATEKLRSERISVPSNVDLHFSTAQVCTAEISLVDKDGNSQSASLPQFNSGESSYIIIEFTGPCEVEKPLLQVMDENGPVGYSYQSHPELSYPDARSGAACCPNNYCWNGYACVEPMGTLTTVSEHVGDGQDYRCIDGQWKESELKFDWNNQQWGFCPQESQCFVLGSGKAENTAQSFYQGEYPICVNNSDYIFDNYCTQGNWTSRTKFLATKLLEVAENDEYVLYCSPYTETMLEVEGTENYLGGEFLVTQQQQQSLSQSLQNQPPKVLPTCFDSIKDPEGKRLVPDDQNTCINNVCVLQYKDGGSFKVAFATTLNKELNDPQSFLVALNVPQDKVGQICQQSGNDFIECDLSNLEFSQSTDLLYSDDLNAVIYARDGIQLSPGVVDNILNWFKDLFGAGTLAEKTFVKDAQNFRNLYIADVDGKKVRAAEEIFPGVRQTLVAEYENFDTPVCEYVKNIKVPPELQLELLEQASGIEKVHCAINDTIQKVVVNAGLDFFWPQLTGKLRIGEMG